jgi:hypothetical protein
MECVVIAPRYKLWDHVRKGEECRYISNNYSVTETVLSGESEWRKLHNAHRGSAAVMHWIGKGRELRTEPPILEVVIITADLSRITYVTLCKCPYQSCIR